MAALVTGHLNKYRVFTEFDKNGDFEIELENGLELGLGFVRGRLWGVDLGGGVNWSFWGSMRTCSSPIEKELG